MGVFTNFLTPGEEMLMRRHEECFAASYSKPAQAANYVAICAALIAVHIAIFGSRRLIESRDMIRACLSASGLDRPISQCSMITSA